MLFAQSKRDLALFLVLLLGLSSCNITRKLNPEKCEKLLVKNSVSVKSPEKIPEKPQLLYELSSLYKQNPNNKLLYLFPTRAWLYNKYKDKNGKFSRWLIKKVAEPPAIHNKQLTERTRVNFENYMRRKGYLDARCSVDSTTNKKENNIKLRYDLDLGVLYKLNDIQYQSEDTAMHHLLQVLKPTSLLKPGSPLDAELFDSEKKRITTEMRERGYAAFVPNYLEYSGDSTNKRANITLELLKLADSTDHKQMRFGDILTYINFIQNPQDVKIDTTIRKIYLASSDEKFSIRPKVLTNAIYFDTDSLYKQSLVDKTYKRLSGLGVFRLVTIRSLGDSTKDDRLNMLINLVPNKRFSVGADLDVNTQNSVLNGRLFGTSANMFFRNKNIFGGAENLQSNIRYGIDLDLSNRDRLINSQEVKLINDLTIPRFMDYLGLWRTVKKLNVKGKGPVSDRLFQRMRTDASARFSAGYTYVDLIRFYTINVFNLSFGYDLRTDNRHQYTWNHIGIDVLNPKTRPAYDTILNQNEQLKRAFGNQLFTGFLLRDFTYQYFGPQTASGKSTYFRFNAELSGGEVHVFNRLYRTITKDQSVWRFGDLDFSKYVKFELDGSMTKANSKNNSFAFHVGLGAAMPFSDSKTVPYVKQLFVGGPASLRAWRIRELGPGSFKDPQQPTIAPFYQTGDFKLDMSAEYRFPLFWWFKGALFLDAGNVWTFKHDADRPGTKLDFNAWKDIAVGTGFGIRGDFNFFILRLDFGLKLKDPYLNERNNYWHYSGFSDLKLRDFNPNLAVGYPF